MKRASGCFVRDGIEISRDCTGEAEPPSLALREAWGFGLPNRGALWRKAARRVVLKWSGLKRAGA